MITSEPMHTDDGNNAYEFNAISVLQLYGEFVEGDPKRTLAIVSLSPLSKKARAALEASAERLGYGARACAWITLHIDGDDLGPNDARTLFEGLDPCAIVTTDAEAAALLSRAYSKTLDLDAVNRAACRTVLALSDFEGALDDDEAKQRAWALLKRLARS